MTVGIIGAGGIGQAFARQLLKAGHTVMLSNRRGPASLEAIVNQLGSGARAGTVAEAAAAPIVVVSVTWEHLRPALTGLPAWNGRIVVDATNPILLPDFRMSELGGRASSEIVADLVPGARLVKVGNTLPPEILAADPHEAGGRRVLFLSGNEASAKGEFGRILETIGFAVVDLGTLATGGRLQQFPTGPLPGLNLVRLS